MNFVYFLNKKKTNNKIRILLKTDVWQGPNYKTNINCHFFQHFTITFRIL